MTDRNRHNLLERGRRINERHVVTPAPFLIGTPEFVPARASGSPSVASGSRMVRVLRRKSLGVNRFGYYVEEVSADPDTGTWTPVVDGWRSKGPVGDLIVQPSASPAGAEVYAPVPGSVLEGDYQDEVVFAWSSIDGATAYKLDVGSSQGGTQYHAGTSGAALSAAVDIPGMPGDGSVVWARLTTTVGGEAIVNDFKYYDPGSTRHLMCNTRELGNVTGNTWVQGNDIWEVGSAFPPNFALMPIGGWPWPPPIIDGRTELWTPPAHPTIVQAWESEDKRLWCSELNQYDGSCGDPVVRAPYPDAGAIISPVPGNTLSPGYTSFSWNAGTDALGYYLRIGSTPEGTDIYDGAVSGTSQGSIYIYGPTIYVDLFTYRPDPPFTLQNSYRWTVT